MKFSSYRHVTQVHWYLGIKYLNFFIYYSKGNLEFGKILNIQLKTVQLFFHIVQKKKLSTCLSMLNY